MTLRVSYAAANFQANALAGNCDGASIQVYSGTQPATPETAATGTLLATLYFGTPAFTNSDTASNGVLTATTISPVTISATGTAGWFRVTSVKTGTPVLWDGAVNTSGAEMNLNSVALSSGATLSISSLTFTVPGV